MWRSCRILENPAGKSHFKGGTGLVSTAADHLRFAQMVANGRALDGQRYRAAPAVRVLLSNRIVGMGGSAAATTGPGCGFAFGVRLADGMGTAPGNPGDAGGAWGTSFTIDPTEKPGAILTAQGPSDRHRTRMIFENLAYGAMVEGRCA